MISQNGARSFPSCPEETVNKVLTEFESTYGNELSKYRWKADEIVSYMSRVEKEVKCTGFYKASYYDSEDRLIFKYLFSDINRLFI